MVGGTTLEILTILDHTNCMGLDSNTFYCVCVCSHFVTLPCFYPARACASKGLCDRSWCLLYIIYYILYIIIYISAKLFSYLSKYSLSDAHFNTGRLLFQFNRLLYTLAAPEVFVSSANPVSLPSGYRVSIVRNTNIDQIETTPLQYCKIRLNTPTWPGQVSLQD